MNTTNPNFETGRITLRLTRDLIRDLRLLAVLLGTNQNALAEDLILKGGLQTTVDEKLNRIPAPEHPETVEVPTGDSGMPPVPLPPIPAQITPPEKVGSRISHVAKSEHAPGGNDDDIPW